MIDKIKEKIEILEKLLVDREIINRERYIEEVDKIKKDAYNPNLIATDAQLAFVLLSLEFAQTAIMMDIDKRMKNKFN